jgi:hypothetical protein
MQRKDFQSMSSTDVLVVAANAFRCKTTYNFAVASRSRTFGARWQTDGFYKFAPWTKEFMSLFGEIQLGACLLGWGCGVTGALIYGGAQNMCVLELAPLALCTYQHYTGEGGKTNALVNTVFMAALAYFGFVR